MTRITVAATVRVVTLLALLVALTASTAVSASGGPPPRPFITGHAVPGGVLVGHPGHWPGVTQVIYYVWFACPPPAPSGYGDLCDMPSPSAGGTFPAASVLRVNYPPGTTVRFYVAFAGQLVASDSVVIKSGH